MQFHLSAGPLWLANKFPRLVKPVLWLWGQYYGFSKLTPHWVFIEMGDRANYRVPFLARLSNGQEIKLAVNDDVGQEILRSGFAELESVSALPKLVKAGNVFFDLGAHVGQFTLLASGLVGPNGAVHSFEPDPLTFEWLSENVKRNNLTNVSVNRLAISDRSGDRELFLGRANNIGTGSFAPPSSALGTVVKVPTISIDEYCAVMGMARIDFMKIDVEGAEIEVLKGCSRFLCDDSRPTIHIEFNLGRQELFGRSLRELADLLEGYGYTLLRLTKEGPREFWLSSKEPTIFNVLAMSRADALALLGSEGT